MSILPKLIYGLNIITLKIPARVFEVINKIILKLIWKGKRIKIAKTILKKKNKIDGKSLPIASLIT